MVEHYNVMGFLKQEITPVGHGMLNDESRRISHVLWGHALDTIAFTLNCISSKVGQKTPYEIMGMKHPSTSLPTRHEWKGCTKKSWSLKHIPVGERKSRVSKREGA